MIALRTLLMCLFLSACLSLITLGSAQEYKFKLAHFVPPAHAMHAELEAWAEHISEASDGRIEITIFPAGQLLGIADIYDGVAAGVADFGWGLPSVNAGRFKGLSVLELPFVFEGLNAQQASAITMDIYNEGLLDGEFDAVKLLYLHTHAPATLHTREQPITDPSDLQGMRIRFPAQSVKIMLEALGATPVGIPAPQVYENLEKGVVDGVAFPFEAMRGLRLGEQLQYHLASSFYTLPFYLAMNQRSFDKLPADLQEIITAHSGKTVAVAVGAVWDEADKAGYDFALEQGNEITTLSEQGQEDMNSIIRLIIDDYLADLADDGVPSHAIYERALALAAEMRQVSGE